MLVNMFGALKAFACSLEVQRVLKRILDGKSSGFEFEQVNESSFKGFILLMMHLNSLIVNRITCNSMTFLSRINWSENLHET